MSALYRAAQQLDPTIAGKEQLLIEIAAWNKALENNQAVQRPLDEAKQRYSRCSEHERPSLFARIKLLEQLQGYYMKGVLKRCHNANQIALNIAERELPRLIALVTRRVLAG